MDNNEKTKIAIYATEEFEDDTQSFINSCEEEFLYHDIELNPGSGKFDKCVVFGGLSATGEEGSEENGAGDTESALAETPTIYINPSEETLKFAEKNSRIILFGDNWSERLPEPLKFGLEVKRVKKKKVRDEILKFLFANYEDLEKLKLRFGRILSAQSVEGSEKLYRCEVDFGEFGTRTIYSGIKDYVSPEALEGKLVLYTVGMSPKKIMGNLSYGMLLACGGDGGFSLIVPESENIKPGEAPR